MKKIHNRKGTKKLLYDNTLAKEIKFRWQMTAFFLVYRWSPNL